MRPATVPRYVQVAEVALRDLCGVDLWAVAKRDRDRLILAACDAETMGEPDDAESWIEAVVYDLWKEIMRERKRLRRP